MTDSKSAAFERVLQQETRWNVCRLNALRPAGLSLFVLLQLGIYGPTPGTWILLAHWTLAFAVFFLARVSARANRWSTFAVPLLDMPAVFLKQWLDMDQSASSRAVATFTIGLFVLLIMLSAFTLRSRQLILCGLLAMGLEFCLQSKAGDTTMGKLGSVATLALAATLCATALARRVEIAHRLSEEQLRAEKLGRYFSPQVAAAIERSEEALAAGQLCEITVMFGDLRGFTAATENLPPAEVLGLLNDFHSRMVAVVFAHDGTLDKYIGDGLMAYFGAPVAQPDHALRALQCALEMQSAIRSLNTERTAQGKPPLRLSIGLHTGPAVVGAIGAANRREFTAVGDTVNVASRMESLTREYNCTLLVSGTTARLIGPAHHLQPLAEARLKGRSEPVAVFAPG